MTEGWYPVRSRTRPELLKGDKGDKGDSGGDGDGGCLATILLALVVWALAFGITVDGKHWKVSCSEEKGVEVKSE